MTTWRGSFALCCAALSNACTAPSLPPASRMDCADAVHVASPHPRSRRFQAFVDAAVKAGLPGLALLIEDGDGLWLGAGGDADIARSIPFETCTPSRVGSVTKTFTATIVLELVDEGTIALDEPAEDQAPPGLFDDLPNGAKVTLRQLLQHTSGIPDYTEDAAFGTAFLDEPDRRWSARELVQYVAGERPLFAPGSRHAYSNTNYVLLELIAEHVANASLKKLFQQRLFAGLDGTLHFDPRRIIVEGTARGYIDLHGGGLISESTHYAIGGHGDGGIVADTVALWAFSQRLFQGQLLSRESLDEMTAFVDVPNPEGGLTGYGLGLRRWQTAHGEGWGHTGGAWGYHAELFYFPDSETTIVTLSNGSLGRLSELFDRKVHDALPALVFE